MDWKCNTCHIHASSNLNIMQDSNGGAISAGMNSYMTIDFSEFHTNQAQNAGAVYSEGTIVIQGTKFLHNFASVRNT